MSPSTRSWCHAARTRVLLSERPTRLVMPLGLPHPVVDVHVGGGHDGLVATTAVHDDPAVRRQAQVVLGVVRDNVHPNKVGGWRFVHVMVPSDHSTQPADTVPLMTRP